MSATHQFLECNLVGEVETIPIANVNFGSNDSADLTPATYPITRGENSFDKYIACKFTGTWTEITNMLFWKSAGAYVTGEDIHAEANASYATPSASDMGGSTIPTVEGSALAIESAEGEVDIVYGSSGVSGYTAYIRMQLQTTGSTPAGAVNQKTLTFQYDET